MANTTDFRRLTDIEKALNELIEDAHQLNTVFEMLKKHIPSKKELLEGNLFGKPVTVNIPDSFINRIYDCQSSADSMLSLLQFYEGAITERINDRGADKLMGDAKTLRRSINETLEQIRATLDTIIGDMPKELMDLGETIRQVIRENAVYETELSFEKNLFYLGWKPVLSLTVKIEGAELKNGGFEEKVPAHGWIPGWGTKDGLMTGDAAEGNFYMRAAYQKAVTQTLNCREGVPVTISFQAKNAVW